jgi:acyl-CoA reductase-like NAD-dependent aldehyde dehydrogenase
MNQLSAQTRAFLESPKKLFINGEWSDAASAAGFDTLNPADGRLLCRVSKAGQQDVDAAVDAARNAFNTRVRDMSPGKRGQLLHRLASLIRRDLTILAEIECIDNGKPYQRAEADMNSAIAHLQYYAGWTDKIEGSCIPVQDSSVLVYTRREPLGVTGLIVPWNFPLVMAVWKLAPALACGNCCILKPAQQTPLSALYLAGLVAEAGFPPGMVQVLTGDGETGALMSHHNGIDKIGFTGSTAVGKKILAASAASNLKKVSLELGGKSPNIIFGDADMTRVRASLVWSCFFNSGQECTLGSRVYVHQNLYDNVLEGLAEDARKLRIGAGLTNPDLGPLISQDQLERVQDFIRSGQTEAQLVIGGNRVKGEYSEGYFVEPTIFAATDQTARIVQEEIFGPVVTVTPFSDEQDLLAMANGTRYGLASAVWTRDVSRAHRVAHQLQSGVVWINGYDMFHPAVPFGGYKESGLGREMGKSALQLYTQEKAVWLQM